VTTAENVEDNADLEDEKNDERKDPETLSEG
jgi:hypothetical protein